MKKQPTILCMAAMLLVGMFLAALTPTFFATQLLQKGEVWTSGNLQYGQTLAELALDGIFLDSETGDTVEGALSWRYPDSELPVGTQRAYYHFQPVEGQYAPYEGSLEIVVMPRLLSVYVTGAKTKEYDGERTTEGEGVITDGVLDGHEVAVVATVFYSDANVGVAKPVEKVELTVTGTHSAGYLPQLEMPPATGSILVSSQAVCADADIDLPENVVGGYDIDLPAVLQLQGPGLAGWVRYEGPLATSGDTEILREAPELTGDRLHLELLAGAGAGKTVTMRFSLVSGNYQTVEAVLRLRIIASSAVAGVSAPNRVYSGMPYQPVGMPMVDGAPVSGARYRYTGRGETQYNSETPPQDAGEYRLEISVPERPGAQTQQLDFAIFRANLTVIPADREIAVGQPLPIFDTFRYEGFQGADTADVLSPFPEAGVDSLGSAQPGFYKIVLTNRPLAKNYDIGSVPGQLTIYARAQDKELYTAPAPGASGWYTAPVTVKNADTQNYQGIALQPNGPFAASVVVSRQGSDGVALYFRGKNNETASALFPCKLDSTAPVIANVVCDTKTGTVTVTASDAHSGIAAMRLYGPDSDVEIAGTGGVFRIAKGGSYTVLVSDIAGNTASDTCRLTLEESSVQTPNTDSDKDPQDSSQAESTSANRRKTGGSGIAGGSGLRDGDSPQDFWNTIGDRIRRVETGGTVRVMSAVQGRIPASVLNALREGSVTLRLIRSDDDILLPGSRIPKLESAVGSYTVEEVLAMLLPVETDGEEELPEHAGAPVYLGATIASATHMPASSPEQPGTSGGESPGEEVLPQDETLPAEAPPQPEEAPAAAVQALATEFEMSIPSAVPQNGKAFSPLWILAPLLGVAALTLAGFAIKLHR